MMHMARYSLDRRETDVFCADLSRKTPGFAAQRYTKPHKEEVEA